MNITLPGNQWSDLTALSAIPINKGLAFQNLSSGTLLAEESDTQPDDSYNGGVQLDHHDWLQSTKHDKKVWLRPVIGNGAVFVGAL